MRNFRRFPSLLFTCMMMLGSIFPTSTTPVLANEDIPSLKVNVVGEGNVMITDVDGGKSQFALESSPFEDKFKEGTKLELKCDGQKQIVSDVSIDGVTQNYEYGNQKLEFDYTMPGVSSEIIVTFSEKKAETKEFEKPAVEEENEEPKEPAVPEEKNEVKDSSNLLEANGIKINFDDNTLSDEDKKILEDYADGKTDAYLDIRKEVAEKTGLDKYVDEDYFLNDSYYDKFSVQTLMFDRTFVLDRNNKKEYRAEAEATLKNAKNLIMPRSLSVIDSANFNPSWGVGSLMNGLWRLSNNRLAFCANGMAAEPKVGDSTSQPFIVDNANLRKALYYGYDGPGNILAGKGYTTEQQIVATDDFASVAYTGNSVAISAVNGYHWRGWIGPLYNEITSMPDPAQYGYVVYMVNVPGSGTNWQGHTVAKQPLVYGAMEPKGNLHLRKRSANTNLTNGNNCYSLEGAEYGLFTDKGCTNQVETFKTDSRGWADKDGIKAGTYYLKELKAPKGYALDTKVHTIVIKPGETTTYGSNGELVDLPQSDPVGILLGKVDKKTNQNKPSGSATLEGAEFTVKFFAGENPNTNGSPTRSWVLRTDKDGFTYLSDQYKVSGDDFYKDSKGIVVLPIGTVTIQETKAPQGYYINNEVFVRKITSSGTVESVNTYNQPKVPEQVNEFVLTKVQIGTKTPIEGTVFTHTFPNGKTEDVKTDANGQIKFTGLSTGQHKLKEKSVMTGYKVNPNEFVFTVDQNGIKSATDLNGKNMTFNAGNTTGTTSTLEVSDTVSDFNMKLIKINENDKKLPGAEFTLYSDKECTKVVDKLTTNESGILEFQDLKDRTTYYFKETKAPQGYRIPLENGKVHVYELRAEAIPAKKQFDFYVDGKKYTTANTNGNVHLEDQNGKKVVSITVVNYTTAQLPETGSNGTIALIGVGVIAMILWFVLGKKKKI